MLLVAASGVLGVGDTCRISRSSSFTRSIQYRMLPAVSFIFVGLNIKPPEDVALSVVLDKKLIASIKPCTGLSF